MSCTQEIKPKIYYCNTILL